MTRTDEKRNRQNTSPTGGVIRSMRLPLAALVAAVVVGACATPAPSSPQVPTATPIRSSTAPSPLLTSTAIPTETSLPTLIPRCVRGGATALTGVVEGRPDGWSDRSGIESLPGFPNTSGRVYGPEGVTVPPNEGPGRLALYETFRANDAYFKSRIEQSLQRDGRPITVTACGEATEVWLDESTGELVVGWTDRDKSDVLVANTADFTVQELVNSAESVYDCCG